MKIQIKLFGITRDIIGKINLETEVESGLTVAQLLSFLKNIHPELAKLSSLMVAVNEEYAHEDALIQEGDEVALIPPVSGG